MDIRDKGWFMSLRIGGISKSLESQGSIMELTAQALNHIREAKARTTKHGVKTIDLRFATEPLSQSVNERAELMAQTEGLIDRQLAVQDSPMAHESHADFLSRLLDEGNSPVLALTLANDAFGLDEMDSEDWLDDPRARRFRQLNASESSFDAADPDEYASLRRYCMTQYPDKLQKMRLRG